MTTTFSTWKKKYKKDRVCKNINELEIWLNQHGVTQIPDIVSKYAAWACKKHSKDKVCLTRFELILHIQGLKNPYTKIILSLFPTKSIIKHEYFNIFGNVCKILHTDMRTIERNPTKEMIVRMSSITATVESQYKEERSGSTISNFYSNIKKRRYSIPIVKPTTKPKRLPKITKISLLDLIHHYQWSTDDYHNKLIRYFTEHIEKKIEEPRLVLMFGLPGSGKNWTLKKKRKRNHVIINIDDCLAMIPGYWRGMLELQERDKRAHDWIQMFRDECKMISNKLFDYAIKNRMNIVWNGTGKNITKYNKLISVANKRGYIIELNGIWVPIELAKRRISKRRDSYGRPVPEKILNLAAINVPSCFKKLKKDKKVSYARIWENLPDLSPRLIWDAQQGWLENTSNIGWISPTYKGSNKN